ncbi:MAG: hypothetical protein NWF00_02045 [Candidatus Bathyarchaeota archaeon]|nr:hypothetical protein [Candidatus Bathyarchaeota archaeon]
MRFKLAVFLFVALLVFQPILSFTSRVAAQVSGAEVPDVYVGIDVAYESVEETKQIIDKSCSYTNLFVIGCLGEYNDTRLDEISQYVYDKNLYFIVYSDHPPYPSDEWFDKARKNWGDKFLGIYFYDEPGGKQLDQADYHSVESAENYTDAAEKYINYTNLGLRNEHWGITQNFVHPTEYQLFTSDYALYWYDYKAGYDTVFAEFGWNYSRQINVALCRGAAAVQNKDWGVMIAWTYTHPPYIESGPELYDDMILAYESGAKYIIVFDSNEDWTAGILQQEHFDAMERFWQYIQDNPRTISSVSERTAYVLPEHYAYGFRGPKDKIWGFWEADEIATVISMSVASLLQVCEHKLDIIYPDENLPVSSLGYGTVVHWNDTRLIPSDWLNTPTSRLSPSPSSPVSPSPTQQLTPTASLPPSTDTVLSPSYVYLAIVGVVVLVLVSLVMLKQRR